MSYDVIKTYHKVPPELVAAFAKLEESASINESMSNHDGALSSHLKPVWPGVRMCGTAFTVQCGAGDNIMLHKAISMAQPGDVLLVTNGMYDEAGGMFGGMMAASLKTRGGVGLVIEGACRDTMMLRDLALPVFSLNVSIKATTKCCPGRINHPIVIGGVRVCPGDLVYGDNDGVVVVPREEAAQVLAEAQAREERERRMLPEILDGTSTTFDIFQANYQSLGLSEEE